LGRRHCHKGAREAEEVTLWEASAAIADSTTARKTKKIMKFLCASQFRIREHDYGSSHSGTSAFSDEVLVQRRQGMFELILPPHLTRSVLSI
jgi:hypothetical protein